MQFVGYVVVDDPYTHPTKTAKSHERLKTACTTHVSCAKRRGRGLAQTRRHGKWEPVPGMLPPDTGTNGHGCGAPGSLRVFVAEPGEWCGHARTAAASSGAESGSSYFDRLWRRGVSKHSAATDRFVLVARAQSQRSRT